MYNKNSNIPPLLPDQPLLQSKIPSLLSQKIPSPSTFDYNKNKSESTFEIKRFDRDETHKIIDTLIQSFGQNEKSIEQNSGEIQTTDYRHGLHQSLSSTSKIQLQPPPPSLLSLKLENVPNNQSIQYKNLRMDSSGNLFPIINEFTSTNFRQTEAETFSKSIENDVIPIENILHKPYRDLRPSKLVIIIRGLPGSGKSYVTNLIKIEEEKHASNMEKPKVFSIDNYFLTEKEETINKSKKKQTVMSYEFDASLVESYQRGLIKSFKKTVDDNLFNFLIIDMVNERIDNMEEMAAYAKSRGFCTYFIEFDPELTDLYFKQNIHDRTLEEIVELKKKWEPLPKQFIKLDISLFNQNKEIENVEMEDVIKEEPLSQNKAGHVEVPVTSVISKWETDTDTATVPVKSKWDLMSEDKLDKLDGISYKKQKKSDQNETEFALNMEEYMSSLNDAENSNKKHVKWLDTEEKKKISKQKAIGFVIGQSAEDRQKLSNDYVPTLESYKYF